ncbi:PqiC family protein [Sneathiella glossodoripedis]|uniref:PqiC family protein n=1 Tax=Sneathiella glossodoripedis TaxID=418853 RepID=UPI000470F91D|nr:PqiC family protein [Sneathiella glossodoripedis]
MKNFQAMTFVRWLIMIGLLPLLIACEGIVGPSTPTEFYRLTAVDLSAHAKGAVDGTDRFIGIGPVSIPGYADRPQIVTAEKDGRLLVDDLHHWAEPVQENIERVLVADFASLMRSSQVFRYPTNFTPPAGSLQIEIVIGEMLKMPDGKIHLEASWTVKNLVDNRLLLRNSIKYVSSDSASNYTQYSVILSGLLGQLSIDILKTLPRG